MSKKQMSTPVEPAATLVKMRRFPDEFKREAVRMRLARLRARSAQQLSFDSRDY